MYIRNAQGQLMWVPPTGYKQPQPVQPTMEMLQQNMRNHVQREEWARFNAPPRQDNLYFEDNFSVFDGSTMHGYTPSVAPSVASNMRFLGQPPQHQHPYQNRMNPPVPQMIGAQPMGPMPHNGGRPNQVTPQDFRNGHPSQPFAGPHNNNVPTNVAFRNGPQPPPSPMFASPANNMHHGPSAAFRNGQNPQAFGPAGFRNGPNPQASQMFGIHRTNSNLSRASVARSVARGHGQPMFAIPRTNSNLSRVSRRVVRNHPQNGVAPSPYGMPEPGFTSPHQQTFMPSTFGIPEEANAHDSSFDEDPPPYHDIKLVPEEKVGPEPKMSCMATLFGSSIEELQSTYQCNELNISTTCADEIECRDDAMAYFFRSPQNGGVKKCTGVRGPGKKFDYIGDRRTDSMDTARESKLTRCLTEKTEKFLDGLQMEKLRIEEDKEKTECVMTSPESFSDESNQPVVPTESEDREAKESVASPDLQYSDESDEAEVRSECRDDVYASEARSEYRDAAYDSEVRSECRDDTYDSEVPSDYREAVASFVTDGRSEYGSVTIDYVPRNSSTREDSDAESVLTKYQKFIQRMEKRSQNSSEHSRSVESYDEVSNKNKKTAVVKKSLPSLDEMDCPSFDEPGKIVTKENPADELPNMCALTESSSDGENNQRKANIWTASPSNKSTSKSPSNKSTSKRTPSIEKSSQRKSNIWTITSNQGTIKINKGAEQRPFGVRSVVN